MHTYVAMLGLLALLALVVATLSLLRTRTALPGAVIGAPFPVGGRPREHAVSRFHVRWYAVTMVFLAFDMEMVFMFPWALVVASVGPRAVIEMFAFLALLVVGVVYAWREGALRWV